MYLEEFKNQAYEAYRWSSFDPAKRGNTTIQEYEKILETDLKDIPVEEQKRYIDGFKKRFSSILVSSSRCASTMITGASKFPFKKNKKALQAYNNKVFEFSDWRASTLKSIEKWVKANRSEEEKFNEEWDVLKKDISGSVSAIIAINNKSYCGTKSLFVNSIVKKVERLANAGDVEIVTKAVEFIREANVAYGTIITERNKFFTFIDVARVAREAKNAALQTKSDTFHFEDGKVIKNFGADRLQILFNEKPDASTIAELKKNSFHWSPSNGVWQRQLTDNAIRATRKLLEISL